MARRACLCPRGRAQGAPVPGTCAACALWRADHLAPEALRGFWVHLLSPDEPKVFAEIWRILKDAYFSVGGFPPVALMEEYYLFQKMRRAGCIEILPEAVVTSARRYEKNGALRNALRNSALLVLYFVGVRPETLARMYK